MFFLDKSPAKKLRPGLIDAKRLLISEPFSFDGILSRSGVVAAVTNVVRPKGPGSCDHNGVEKTANIITSLPFIAIGLNTYRKRKSLAGKAYGGSLVGVGLASGLFHGSPSKWKGLTRKLDYWACALSATCLSKSVFPDMPWFLFGACLGMIPFRPLLVTSLNTLAIESQFYKRSITSKGLKKCHYVHNAACATGVSLFYLEDKKTTVPLMHAGWHLMSCVGCSTVNGLLADEEMKTEWKVHDKPFRLYV